MGANRAPQDRTRDFLIGAPSGRRSGDHIESAAMRRWVLILFLLLLVMPFQTVWAVAASYCGHESAPGVQHFGHHQHQHQAEGDSNDASSPVRGSDVDCGSCQLASPVSVPAPLKLILIGFSSAPPPHLEPRYRSRVPAGPERPERQHVRSAVRFGSAGVRSLSTI